MMGTGLYRLYCWFVSAALTWAGVLPTTAARLPITPGAGRRDPRQGDLLRDLVADQGIAVAVEDQAPGRRHRHRPDLIGHDRLGGGRGLEDVECPQPEPEQAEQGRPG